MYECFNRCSYCNFRVDPGDQPWIGLEDVEKCLQKLQKTGISEILVLAGEVHPKSDRRLDWLKHIYTICEFSLSYGFLPHTNVGPLSFEEMALLKSVNVSMGLMLEQVTPDLLQTVHRHAPSKDPTLRLQQLEWAGKLNIPFTTGVLFGIGETEQDWLDSLEAIAQIHGKWGHIQEVILQPYSPGTKEKMQGLGFSLAKLPKVVAIARRILPSDITLQIPPNLVQQPDILLACLEAGARDLGGISPIDEVNPDYPHIQAETLRGILQPAGWTLQERLPIYPRYEDWLSPTLRESVQHHRDRLLQLHDPALP
jgi:FO synthase subunit 1